jgi:acyl-CoA thioester hydrolase
VATEVPCFSPHASVLACLRHRVGLRDVDGSGYAHFAAPFAWEERTYMLWLRTIGRPFPQLLEDGIGTPAVHTSASYHRPLQVDDLLELRLSAVVTGTTSYTLQCVAVRLPETEPAVTVRVVYVFTRSERRPPYRIRVEPLPSWLRAALPSPSCLRAGRDHISPQPASKLQT